MPTTTHNEDVIADDMVEQIIKLSKRTNYIYDDCKPITGHIYTDQSSHVLIPSSSGIKYAMFMYDFDINFIWAITVPSKTKLQLVNAYKRLFLLMQRQGLNS